MKVLVTVKGNETALDHWFMLIFLLYTFAFLEEMCLWTISPSLPAFTFWGQMYGKEEITGSSK